MVWSWKMSNKIYLFFIFIFFISCGSKKEIPVAYNELENISESRLFKNITLNQLEYNTMYSKKMNVILDIRGNIKSFKATMRVYKDNFIWLSMKASLGIEVGRILLTPDSVRFINLHDKTYFISDYSYFGERYGINITFNDIQKILSNHFFNFDVYSLQGKPSKKYKLDRKDRYYLLYTLEESSIDKQLKKLYKKKLKNKEFSLILQKVKIDPLFFRPSSISIEDLDEKIEFEVSYGDFKIFDNPISLNSFFPTKISFSLFSQEEKLSLKIEIDKLEFNVPIEPSFKIPDKYKKIK
jgi:hypothetical protein